MMRARFAWPVAPARACRTRKGLPRICLRRDATLVHWGRIKCVPTPVTRSRVVIESVGHFRRAGERKRTKNNKYDSNM